MTNKQTVEEEVMREFDEKFEHTPAISGLITDSDVCCNCGEDLSLELYYAFSEGYKMAIEDTKQFIRSIIHRTRTEVREELKPDLSLILDFVERWNKQDKESNVSQAAQRLATHLGEDNKIV